MRVTTPRQMKTSRAPLNKGATSGGWVGRNSANLAPILRQGMETLLLMETLCES